MVDGPTKPLDPGLQGVSDGVVGTLEVRANQTCKSGTYNSRVTTATVGAERVHDSPEQGVSARVFNQA